MAGSLDVIRQAHRITSPAMTPPGHFHNVPPAPPSSQRRLVGSARFGGSAAPPLAQQGKNLPVGMPGRHSWTGNASSSSALLSNRFNRLSLRLSAPTPGEEELCRHWMQNSAKYCRRDNANQIHMSTIRSNASIQQNIQQLVGGQSKQFERPSTVQAPPSSFRHPDLSPGTSMQRVHSAGPRRIVVKVTTQNEYITSSESERITSPSVSQRSSPSPATRKLMKQSTLTHRPSTSSHPRVNSPSAPGRDVRMQPRPHTSQPRPPSARPSEIRWRNRAKTPVFSQDTRPNSGERDMPPRRWSFNDNMMSSHNDVTKDDDSAYSSSRDITINIENGHVTSKSKDTGVGDVTRSPPRSSNSNRVNSGRSIFPDTEDGTKGRSAEKQRHHVNEHTVQEVKGQDSKVKLSNQGGHSVFYYHRNNANIDAARDKSRMISIDDNGPPFTRHNALSYGRLLPLRNSPSKGRPVTQPAMGPPHARTPLKRKSSDTQRLQNTGNNVTQRILPQSLPVPGNSGTKVQYHVGPKFHPVSVSDYDVINKQRKSGAKNQRHVTSNPSLPNDFTPYINPEVGQRVVEWLASVEQNPEVYYGFETDMIGI